MKRLAKTALVIGAIIALAFWYIGYFGGPLFADRAPTSPTPANRAGLVAVYFSGDAGPKIAMGSMIGSRLAADGIPVVGVNTLTYFRTARTPADAANLVVAAIDHAIAEAHASRVVLIGHSFGADMLPVGLAGLPQSLRAKVQLVELVVPGSTVQFKATPGGVLSVGVPEVSAAPTAKQLDWVPGLCVQGIEEERSLCPLMRQPNVTRIAMPGGHALHWDADGLHARLLAAIDGTSPKVTKISG